MPKLLFLREKNVVLREGPVEKRSAIFEIFLENLMMESISPKNAKTIQLSAPFQTKHDFLLIFFNLLKIHVSPFGLQTHRSIITDLVHYMKEYTNYQYG